MRTGLAWLFIAFVIALLAAAMFFALPADAQVEPTEAQPVALATATLYAEPSGTPSLTMTSEPTVNSALTAAAMNMTAAADNLRAAAVQATAIVEAEQIAAQASDRKAQSDERIAAAAIRLQELKNVEAEAQRGMMEIAQERDRLHNEAIGLNIRKSNTWATYLTGGGLVLLALAMLVMAWVRWQTSRPEADEQEEDLPGYPGGVDIRLFTASIPPDVLRAVAVAVTSGTPFTHDALTPKIIREAHMATLQYLMTKHGLARWVNESHHSSGCDLLPRGRRFFADIARTTPPLVEDASKVAGTRQQDAIDDGFMPVGEGGAA